MNKIKETIIDLCKSDDEDDESAINDKADKTAAVTEEVPPPETNVSDSSAVVDTISETDESEAADQCTVPNIKLVDINKLLKPNVKPKIELSTPLIATTGKNRKSVTFDDSVILLTSSDEDTPKKNPNDGDSSTPLKSVLRNRKDSDKKRTNNVLVSESSDESSKSDTINKIKKRIGNKMKPAPRNVKIRATKQKNQRKGFPNNNGDSSSSDEDSSSSSSSSSSCDKKAEKINGKKEAPKIIPDSSSTSESEIEELRISPIKSNVLNDPKFGYKVYVKVLNMPQQDLGKLGQNYESCDNNKNEQTTEVVTNTVVETKKLQDLNKISDDASDSDDIVEQLEESPTTVASDANLEDEFYEELQNEIVDNDESLMEEVALNVEIESTIIADESLLLLPEPELTADTEESSFNDDTNISGVEIIIPPSDRSDVDEAELEDPSQIAFNLDSEDEEISTQSNNVVAHNEEAPEEETPLKENKIKVTRKNKNKRKGWQSIIDSDSEEESSANNDKIEEETENKEELDDSAEIEPTKKRTKKAVLSDSDYDQSDEKSSDEEKEDADEQENKKKRKKIDSDAEYEKEEEEEEEEKEAKKPSRKRIKRLKDSSSEDEENKGKTRKQLRKMIDRDALSESTRKAESDEQKRIARIMEKQKKYNQIFDLKADATTDKVVLDFDETTNEPLLSVDKELVKELKPHQVLGVKFMWDACFESLKRTQSTEGSGCILAHCMGLGKTLQVITLAHTLLGNEEKTKISKILVVCPVSTILNWKNEFNKWIPEDSTEIDIYELVTCKSSQVNQERSFTVKSWHTNGGVLIIGYNMFRTLSNPSNKTLSKRLRKTFQEGLVDPGPDLVVCDEGHLLKNEKTNLSIAMNRIKTLRRIVLTGTPLQNNLKEYWCMVQFIKPNLLGTFKEYLNRFVNPITNGQYTDSTQHDIMIMRRRSHVLHKLLDGVVQRQDYGVLQPYLPPKYEYVLFLKLTKVQTQLYQHYMANFARGSDGGSTKTAFLFNDIQELQRICTHPKVLLDKSIENRNKREKEEEENSESEGSIKDFIDDESASDVASSSSSSSDSEVAKKPISRRRSHLTRAKAAEKREAGLDVEIVEATDQTSYVQKYWWDEYVDRSELDNLALSSKMNLLFQILKECEEIGDKVLVFSQSLYTLNCIEYFLGKVDEVTHNVENGQFSGSWSLGLDYFRLDGSASCDNRANWCDEFNNPKNIRARLFLISTKAGGLGINLVAANRVIIFDVSWNPSHDIQSIYRVYRFGQTKPCYIYRFVTYGTMEMKIYERQVTKQAISKRVIDEQQIDRHYSQNDIMELYNVDLEPKDRPIPLVPKDVLLAEMLQNCAETIYKYHEHQSLLENKQDEQLNEDERKAAWEEFENEKVIRKTTFTNLRGLNSMSAATGFYNNPVNFSPQMIQIALANIVLKDNPTWSEVQIKGIIPALVQQLRMQVQENDFTMYNRVQKEIQLIQQIQIQEEYVKHYKMLQRQQQQQQLLLANQNLGGLNVNPEDLQRLINSSRGGAAAAAASAAASANSALNSNEVIELND